MQEDNAVISAIDARQLTEMFIAGAANLEANKEWINELNVFPVPDGDTGTNMTLTIKSAVKEVQDLGENAGMKDVCKAMSSGSLRGARGNSGVILSQLIRGFSKVARPEDTLAVPVLADAFDRAVETAYKAVMKPKEGTILTVAKAAAVKSRELADKGTEDLDEFFGAVLAEAADILEKTPDMLPVLKQAGVVDSGGQGLVQFMKGAYDRFQGKEIDYSALKAHEEEAAPSEKEPEEEELRFIYRLKLTLFMPKKPSSSVQKDYVEYLKSLGDKVKCGLENGILYVRVNTNDPGLVLNKSMKLGEIDEVRIINLRAQKDSSNAGRSQESTASEAEEGPGKEEVPEMPHKEVGFVTVSAGDGIREIFRGLGVDYVLSGGQTMNPSTQDVLGAIEKVNADTVFILPNNKNIIMAANQAAELTGDKKVVVVPTTTIPQGITAVINYMPDLDAEGNKESMVSEIANVRSAEVTYAVRDTVIDDIEIHEGDIMSIGDNGILASGKNIEDTAFAALHKIVNDETEIVSIYYGKDVTEENAQKLQERAAQVFENCDVELQYGGQPIYYYILSAE